MLIEVIACSLADALEAERGGAGRLELVRELDRGGLTPAVDFVAAVLERVTIPVRAMVRERDGYEAGSAHDVERLAGLAARLAASGVDGLVMGFLRGGRLDAAALSAVLAGMAARATFHHAFDDLPEPIAALTELGRWARIDRVLTSGGPGDWQAKVVRLDRLAAAAPPSVTILAGGGVDAAALRTLARSSVEEAHVGRAARVPPTVHGAVSASRVAELVEAARR